MVDVEQLHDVSAVEVVRDFRLRLTFADGTLGEVDFTERVWRGVMEPLGDPAYFARWRNLQRHAVLPGGRSTTPKQDGKRRTG